MNKLNEQFQSLTLSSLSRPDTVEFSAVANPSLKSVRRLIVLVPNLEADLALAARRVWELASTTNSHVQFLGLYTDAVEEPRLRRELVTMSAMVSGGNISAEAVVMSGKDWVEVVKTRFQTGDLVICFAEQHAGSVGKPLNQILQSNLDVPLYILSGLYPRNDLSSNWLTQLAGWAGSIAIILGFFLLQVKIDGLEKDWFHYILLLLSVPSEVWAIWVWNNLFESKTRK